MLRKWLINRKLQKTLKPDASYWERRLRALDPERRAHVLANLVVMR